MKNQDTKWISISFKATPDEYELIKEIKLKHGISKTGDALRFALAYAAHRVPGGVQPHILDGLETFPDDAMSMYQYAYRAMLEYEEIRFVTKAKRIVFEYYLLNKGITVRQVREDMYSGTWRRIHQLGPKGIAWWSRRLNASPAA